MLFLSATALFWYHVCRVRSASRWVLGSGVPTVSRAVLGSSGRKNRGGCSLFHYSLLKPKETKKIYYNTEKSLEIFGQDNILIKHINEIALDKYE